MRGGYLRMGPLSRRGCGHHVIFSCGSWRSRDIDAARRAVLAEAELEARAKLGAALAAARLSASRVADMKAR